MIPPTNPVPGQDPLSQLRDIHLPEPISWWPPAPGWWILCALLLLTTGWFVRRQLRQRAHNRYRKQALSALDKANCALAANGQNIIFLQSVLSILRRTTKTAYPDLQLEAAPIPQLLDALNGQCSEPQFDQQLQQSLSSLLYQANSCAIDSGLTDSLYQGACQWVRTHRRESQPC